ncbi:hypothetical protein HYV79_03715 [Candidatus Woesearchaeota archaeon]|nr:hypothetical protein [Candidatus Woesearchaeota archaeon]
MAKNQSKIAQIILCVGILVVFVTFVMYGLEVFVPSPDYHDFCEEKPFKEFLSKEECEQKGGAWSPNYPKPIDAPLGYCDADYTCRKLFEKANQQNQRIILIITSIIGVLSLISGVFLKVPSVAYGIMSGGIVVFVIGVIRAWSLLSKYVQFALFGVLLALLIWFSYKKFGK